MGTIYGINIHERGDKYCQLLERMAEVAETILLPGNFLVEAFPVLRYLPSWLPGGGFKTWAGVAKQDIAYIVDDLFDGAKESAVSSVSAGSRRPCSVSTLIPPRSDRKPVETVGCQPHLRRFGAAGLGRASCGAGEAVQGGRCDSVPG